MRTQNNSKVLVPTNKNDLLVAARVCYFVRMNLPKFLESQVGKDQKNSIDQVKYIFDVISVTSSDR